MTSALSLPLFAEEFLLRPDMYFLNHGSFGACPRPVFSVYQEWQRELEAQPVAFLSRRLPGLLAEARGVLGRYVGTSADRITFVPNATHGVNIVARSLDLRPGDEVLATDHEYGAVDRTWRFICARRGARYINQPIAVPVRDAETIVAQLWAGVTERTRVIAMSHISSSTALTFPVAEICRRARAEGILTLIDGAHAPGQIDLSLDALGADFYTGNCHKWLCAPKGAGFLYARPERQALLHPLIVSWGWESEQSCSTPFIDYFSWTGTHDPAAYLSVSAAIAFQVERNWAMVRAACHALLLDASQRVAARTGLPHISPDTGDWWAQMRTIPLPPCDLEQLQARLWDAFQVEAMVTCWRGMHALRVSIQCYNRPADVERLLEGLVHLLPV